MPGFDGTGPAGQGPMTGKSRGYCAVPLNTAGGRFFGRGMGRGWRRRFWARGFGRALSKDEELAAFKEQEAYLKDELDATQASIRDLEKQ